MVARTPPANVRTIHTATKVPPVIAPTTAHNIKISPGFFDFAFIATTANIIVRNENNNPINPNPAMPVDADVSIAVSDKDADAPSKPATNPPAIKVNIAAKVPKIPPISAIIPPGFCITSSYIILYVLLRP